VEGIPRVKVLADRHHAGLYYSLQLLGDRLGWDLYTPVGHEWWDEGYWRFGEVFGDDRLAAQYLVMDAKWTSTTGPWAAMRDREYPDREIHGVSLAEVKAGGFGIVMATVQENQAGFARLAREIGAQYVYQVGNTRQEIDWSLGPAVIASSEVPLVRGVRYLQEMHPAYHFRPPTRTRSIKSFVNLMPRIECWPLMWDNWQRLVDFEWRIHGADCPDGIVNPTTAVADAMASAGFGWHDKPTGDGFGHVLWGWAAIGRPLIGHGHHYKGQSGEVFWQDGITCIDLDLHPDAAALVRAVAGDPDRHAEMCDAIRRTFEAHYDPERDAQAIREFLA
jgi:hypothetical protein